MTFTPPNVKLFQKGLKFCHKEDEKVAGGADGRFKGGGGVVLGVVLKENGAVGGFSRRAGRMRGGGVRVAWGIEGKVIPAAFRRRKPPVYSSSLWNLLIFNRYNSWGVISIR